MIKIDEIDFFAFEGCSESEVTELLGKKTTGYNDWIINIKQVWSGYFMMVVIG